MTVSHDYSRLYHRGLRGFERADRSELIYQRIMCVALTAALIGALHVVGAI